MNYSYSLFVLFAVLLVSCGAPDNAATTTDESPATQPAPPPSPETTSTTSFGNKEMCDLYTATAAAEAMGCSDAVTTKARSRDYSLSCTYSCMEPFANLSASVVWRKDGADQDVSERDNNPALEKVTIPGSDAAHFVEAQGRLMVAKGKFLLSIQMVPGTRETIFQVAQDILPALE